MAAVPPTQPGYQQGGYPPAGGYQPAPQEGYQQQAPQEGYQQQAPPQGGYQPAPPGFQSPPPGASAPPPGPPGPPGEQGEQGADDRPPSPPPLSDMDRVGGYENVNFQADAFIPPPAYKETAPEQQGQTSQVDTNIPTISEDEAREALKGEVANHCCYGKGAAENLVFTNMVPSSAFHYQLETYTEGRKTAWAFDPYSGQPVDGPQNGPAPGPWDLAAQPSEMFKDEVKVFEVPHTASVKPCHGCLGVGMTQCRRCLGGGQITCTTCTGSGRVLRPHIHHDHHHHGHGHHGHGHHGHGHHGHHHHGAHVDMESVPCTSCHGAGRKTCWTCHGSGRTKCSVCQAKGQLKCYIKLTVSFKNNKVDHIVERTALPDHLIRQAQGKVVFKDTQPRVFPVNGGDPAVNDASRQLIESHNVSFPTERVLSQRHWIRIVPVSEARCNYKGKPFTYWVYGYGNNVHAPDYPQQMCWGCNIL